MATILATAYAYHLLKKSKSQKCDLLEYFNNRLKCIKNKRIKNISKLCKICMQEENLSLCMNSETEELFKLFNIPTEDDSVSKYLCRCCVQFIKTVDVFRKLAKMSNDLLLEVKNEVNTNCAASPAFYDSDGSQHSFENRIDTLREFKKTNKFNLKQTTKKTNGTKVTCQICNKVVTKAYYKQHVTMHNPNHKNYVCDICGKSFRLRCAYHNHSLRHRSDFPFKCQLCPYKGKYSALLKNHMKTHTEDYRYMCMECPARFHGKSNLNRHMLKHKEPQLKCESCNRAFYTNLALKRHHEVDHMGIKNHVCNICGKAFGYRNAMMKHQINVHKRQKCMFRRMPSYLAAENKDPG